MLCSNRLSYKPLEAFLYLGSFAAKAILATRPALSTTGLLVRCSNQLSYRPITRPVVSKARVVLDDLMIVPGSQLRFIIITSVDFLKTGMVSPILMPIPSTL